MNQVHSQCPTLQLIENIQFEQDPQRRLPLIVELAARMENDDEFGPLIIDELNDALDQNAENIQDNNVKNAFIYTMLHVRGSGVGYKALELLEKHLEPGKSGEDTPVKSAFLKMLASEIHADRFHASHAIKDHMQNVNPKLFGENNIEKLIIINYVNFHAISSINSMQPINNESEGAFYQDIVSALIEDGQSIILKKPVKAVFVYALTFTKVYLPIPEYGEPTPKYIFDPADRLKAAEILAPYAARDPEINEAMVEAFKNDPSPQVRQVAAGVADCSGKDLTRVNFSDLPHLPKVDKNTTVIPPEWCKPKLGLLGIGNVFDEKKATSPDIAATNKRFEGVPPEELERQFLQPHQLSIPQRFGLRMMLQQGRLPHSVGIDTDWDKPAFQSVPAAESLEIPQLLTDSAAVRKYLRDHHIGLATGDHSQHQDRNGGKTLPPTFRGALIRDFNGNGRTMPKDLRGTWWNNATAIGADFQGADLSGATLIGVDLSKANLSGVNLSGARLVNCKINGANLSGAIMDCTWIENCTITDSVMHGGVIQDVIVTASYINNLTLHGMDENPMMIMGLYLSDSVVLDYALMGNCHVQQIEVHGSAVVGQSNGHVPPVELDYCPLSYYADQPPLRGLSKLILPPNGMVVRQIDCDRQVQQTGAIGSSLFLTVVDADGQPIDDKLLLEHLAGVQIGCQLPQANHRKPFSRNPQLPTARQHWPDVVDAHDAAPFRALVRGAGR